MLKFKTARLFPFAAIVTLMACNSPADDTKKDKHSSPSSTVSQQSSAAENADNIDLPKISHALGHFIGRNLKAPGIEFDLDSMIKGLRDGAAGKPAPMSDEEYEKAMTQLQEKAFHSLADKNLEAANSFMQTNATTKDVIEIEPGKLQYVILEQGTGPTVPEHGTPQINYTGKYIDGTVFGSSDSAGGPITIPIDQTIPGFTKGIAGMKEGEKRRLFVHPDLGYGKAGQLPPNSMLIFDIEVIKAESPEKDAVEKSQVGYNDDQEYTDNNLERDINSDDQE